MARVLHDATAGTYDLKARVALVGSGGVFHVEMDGSSVASST